MGALYLHLNNGADILLLAGTNLECALLSFINTRGGIPRVK